MFLLIGFKILSRNTYAVDALDKPVLYYHIDNKHGNYKEYAACHKITHTLWVAGTCDNVIFLTKCVFEG